MIKAKHISKHYGELKVLDDINLEIQQKEIISIVGPSGVGKTTLLQILGTLEQPDKNNKSSIEISGQQINGLKKKALARFRNENIGFIFQFHQLLPEFSAIENICIPAFINNTSKSEAEKRAKELLGYLDLGHRAHHKPNELSGGEQQRVAVARALINQPKVIFADEPSGNLDSASADKLHQLFLNLRDEFDQTFVIVTHNEELADMADRKLEMKDGKFV
ncbi:ABC transporter ATP-binding protein [Psychroflexus sp. CAK57W]|uniref:ABC transporter ATP-binding protein n=1 Tax=Psychroflexus curvus TaxID=2873595 RepID=UPI001CC99F3A|nr:ABC transporter ATP-binding protein [Psychroflexus curvus]MBZ9626751.1 ABC transporter ATP-binding protein [Psychroflexus curvus]MBZ9786526.1 ABC transporter ATP-binding protein [Psychroflexus curvus]